MADEAPQKVLLFISHQPENLKVATSFLKKRDFAVHVESDVKDGIALIFELKPDFVFVSWDHTDKKVQMLPKILAQSTSSIVVPFINKNTKDAIFKIEQCPYSPKLYPPLSGPSVERLIMKSSKEDADYLEKVKKFKSAESRAEMARIQQNLADEEAANSPEHSENVNELPPDVPNNSETEAELTEKIIPAKPKEEIQKASEHRNNVLEEEKRPLTEEQKLNIQKTLHEEIQPSLENVISATEEAGADIPPKKSERKNTLIFKDSSPNSKLKSAIYISKGSATPMKSSKPGLTVAEEPEEKTIADGETPSLTNFAHCISLVSSSWCGYFMIFSNSSLDFPMIELVFSDWLKTQMKNLEDISERDYFNFEDITDETVAEIKKMADYSEVLKTNNREFSICFFAVEPKDMRIDLSPDKNYIEVYTRDIPPQAALNFDLLLHLPENQKFLLFTVKDMALTEDQRSRLLNRNVTKLFTKLENEYEFRRFLVMKTFSRLFDVINNRLTGQ